MRLKDEFVVFHLSPEGREALRAVFPDANSVRGYVVDVDEFGVWIWASTERVSNLVPVVLLKRRYFSAVEFDMDPNSLLGSHYIDLELS